MCLSPGRESGGAYTIGILNALNPDLGTGEKIRRMVIGRFSKREGAAAATFVAASVAIPVSQVVVIPKLIAGVSAGLDAAAAAALGKRRSGKSRFITKASVDVARDDSKLQCGEEDEDGFLEIGREQEALSPEERFGYERRMGPELKKKEYTVFDSVYIQGDEPKRKLLQEIQNRFMLQAGFFPLISPVCALLMHDARPERNRVYEVPVGRISYDEVQDIISVVEAHACHPVGYAVQVGTPLTDYLMRHPELVSDVCLALQNHQVHLDSYSLAIEDLAIENFIVLSGGVVSRKGSTIVSSNQKLPPAYEDGMPWDSAAYFPGEGTAKRQSNFANWLMRAALQSMEIVEEGFIEHYKAKQQEILGIVFSSFQDYSSEVESHFRKSINVLQSEFEQESAERHGRAPSSMIERPEGQMKHVLDSGDGTECYVVVKTDKWLGAYLEECMGEGIVSSMLRKEIASMRALSNTVGEYFDPINTVVMVKVPDTMDEVCDVKYIDISTLSDIKLDALEAFGYRCMGYKMPRYTGDLQALMLDPELTLETLSKMYAAFSLLKEEMLAVEDKKIALDIKFSNICYQITETKSIQYKMIDWEFVDDEGGLDLLDPRALGCSDSLPLRQTKETFMVSLFHVLKEDLSPFSLESVLDPSAEDRLKLEKTLTEGMGATAVEIDYHIDSYKVSATIDGTVLDIMDEGQIQSVKIPCRKQYAFSWNRLDAYFDVIRQQLEKGS